MLCSLVPIETELYDVLGAKDLHPDKNLNDPEAIEKFQELAAAYELLSDPDAREAYDSFGMSGIGGRGPGGAGGMNEEDFFAQFFGSGPQFGFGFGPGMGGGGKRTKGQDSVIPYEVTLEDLYNGKSVKMMMEKEIVCGTCKGSGAKGSAKPRKCAKCEGKGWTHVQTQIAPSRLGTSRAVCPDCEGHGEKLREKDRCKKCKGDKTVKEKTRQEIFVEQGMSDGQRIVLAGAGDQEPGVPAGDVIFVLKAHPHKSFERSGNDLLTTVKITLSEAVLGFNRILVNHLDGRGLHVSSPPGKVVSAGSSIVLRGEGMPTYKSPDMRGDLYVVLDIEMPDEQWMKSIDRPALEALLPPKKADVEPKPQVVDEVPYEESDMVEVRARSFPAGSDFFDQVFASQFGEGADDDAWEDDEDEDGAEPECRTQ
ncbi:hypothetical protein EW146_g1418 [Bondarzewia mesenterica]|uniref:DnaJ-domain-containing protein n=1 Tax=Bondarzewia mesenterica TaxID=1095465 RepID=A0A4S4M5N7_9AGAM|nr:hypothetical protein EW146_g1418 [Bondarzewia mesenterica]